VNGAPDWAGVVFGAHVGLPATREMGTDQVEQEVGELIAEEQAFETAGGANGSFSQPQRAFEISKHLFDPEAFLVPVDSLMRIRERGRQIPGFVSHSADDDIGYDRALVTIGDLGEQ